MYMIFIIVARQEMNENSITKFNLYIHEASKVNQIKIITNIKNKTSLLNL